MFTDAYVETNYSEMENDEVKPVNAKLDDKINVDKMNFADADAEKHESAGSYFETSRSSSRGRRPS